MRLFLIRHGETVDNVAGLYAGSRDSALTAHGVLQARKLATHLAEQVTLTHLFASNLGRAVKTAEAVCDAQKRTHQSSLEVVQLIELREKHFGTGEGVKYGMKGPKVEHHGAESPEAMKLRADAFLDDYLVPLLVADDTATVCVVSHGITLAVLFSALCARLPHGSISIAPEAQTTSFPGSGLRPTWSNTGYLEGALSTTDSPQPGPSSESPRLGFKLFVKSVNCVDHVKGLKKTRGGIGSAKFDDKQKTMDSFFKPSRKRKLEDEESPTTQWYVHFLLLTTPEAHDEKNEIHRPVLKYICGNTLSNRCLTAS